MTHTGGGVATFLSSSTGLIGPQLFNDPVPDAEITCREIGCKPRVEMLRLHFTVDLVFSNSALPHFC
jgi:hypothetical protein